MMPDIIDINEQIPDILEAIKRHYDEYDWNIQWNPPHSHSLGGWIMVCRLGDYTCESNISKQLLMHQREAILRVEVIFDCAKGTIKKIDSLVKKDLKEGNLVVKNKLVTDENGNMSIEYWNQSKENIPKTLKDFQEKIFKDNPYSLIDFSETN